MKKTYLIATALCGLFTWHTAAHATVTDNASLVDPPGLYFGSGNSNTGFTVDTENNVEVGLSAIDRYVGAITPTGSTYNAPTGDITVPGHTGSAWGVDFSINLAGSGLNLSNITAILTVTDANNPTAMVAINLLNSIPDNTCYNGSKVECTPSGGPSNLATSTDVQNSEPGSLLSIAGDPNFQDSTLDTYIYTLTVTNTTTGDRLAQDTITINAVPEPATFGILAAGLAGLGLTRRRRRSSTLR